jgi:hypothetical protein
LVVMFSESLYGRLLIFKERLDVSGSQTAASI